MEAGNSMKLIFYFVTNCPRRIVCDELSGNLYIYIYVYQLYIIISIDESVIIRIYKFIRRLAKRSTIELRFYKALSRQKTPDKTPRTKTPAGGLEMCEKV